MTGMAHVLLGMARSRHMQHHKQRDATPMPRQPVADRGVYALCAIMTGVTFVDTADDLDGDVTHTLKGAHLIGHGQNNGRPVKKGWRENYAEEAT